jgi:hypothetical protein
MEGARSEVSRHWKPSTLNSKLRMSNTHFDLSFSGSLRCVKPPPCWQLRRRSGNVSGVQRASSTLIQPGRLSLPAARLDLLADVGVSCRPICGERHWPPRRGPGSSNQASFSAQLAVD